MTMTRRLTVFLAICTAGATGAMSAEPRPAARNVVLVTADGVRWQEVFRGAEETLLNEKDGGVADAAVLRRDFWRSTPEARRQALMPFLWSEVARRGQIYGNRDKASPAKVANGMNFSYPGYNELLTGWPDPRVDSNDKRLNPNVTVFEWLNRKPAYRGKVTAVGSWDLYPFIFNVERSGLYVNAGWVPFEEPSLTEGQVLLNKLIAQAPRMWDDCRDDAFSVRIALEHLRRTSPRVLYIGLGDTDEHAHAGRYDKYLRALHDTDANLKTLWDELQSRPEYRGSTTMIVTTDHGRGDPPHGWRDHGTKTPGSEAIWMTVIGPDTPSLGERTNIGMVTQGQVAATVAALLGEDYLADVPNAARPIADMIAPAAKTVEVPAVEPLRRIAFGSCATQARPQPIWDAVVATRPELTLLLGDNIYADTLDMNVMRAKYARFAAMPGFQSLRKTCPILATWDDHDLGLNDAGGDYPKKDESQKIFLDFFGDPDDSPRRHRPGVYDAKVFGPAGKRVQVILLDTRYFRSALKRKAGPRNPSDPYEGNTDPTTTILGEAQWRWLGEQLRVPAEVRLLASSIQVVAEDHGFEKWMNFPHERDRLFNLIRDTGAEGVIILSGDRHLAELSMMDARVGYPIYDVTASGFNQATRSWRPFETNRHRVATMNWGDNFGVVNIDWDQPDPRISMQIRDVDGDITIQQKIRLSTIRRKTVRPRQELSPKP
jgi:alkaline phosphatase D